MPTPLWRGLHAPRPHVPARGALQRPGGHTGDLHCRRGRPARGRSQRHHRAPARGPLTPPARRLPPSAPAPPAAAPVPRRAHASVRRDHARHHRPRDRLLADRTGGPDAPAHCAAPTGTPSGPIGRPFPIRRAMQRITLDVILRTVFGMDDGPLLATVRERIERLLAGGTNPTIPPPPPPRDPGP